METTQLKRFATEARQLLRQGVINKIALLGFNENGEVEEGLTPVLVQGATNFGGRIIEGETFYHQWMALRKAVSDQGVRQVYEEAAYTWFNRFIAIRILQKNGIIEPVLDFADESRTPQLVKNAQMGILPMGMSEREQRRLNVLLNDPNKVTEQFAILITAFCHATPLIDRIFGRLDDYTELLLPDNILAPDGFLDRLNNTPYITEEDYRHTELIGWLYQFYISERKDEVFASFQKGRKAEAEDIPAATQIFTPNWIVKYMVENTLGRIYLDHNPDAPFKDEMRYLVDECPTPEGEVKPVLQFDSPEELKCADLSCGSGHILTEFFDLLLKIYDAEWYDPHDAIENIFRHNLTGIDIDTRAKQLSVFALMLKACQIDKSFADAHILPKVYDMPKPYDETVVNCSLEDACQKFVNWSNSSVASYLRSCLETMKDANSLGSIMDFKVEPEILTLVNSYFEEWLDTPYKDCPKEILAMLPGISLLLTLNEQYSAIAMNPPYMGSGNMNGRLSQYVKDNYPDSKADLFSVFMDVAINHLDDNGKYGMINMHSWMFLSSFESLRRNLIEDFHIDSLMHLGPRTFDELSGEVVQNAAFVVTKSLSRIGEEANNIGTYFRLVDGRNCADKERMFLSAKMLPKIYYPNVPQENFYKIPGCPIGYWVSDKIINIFSGTTLSIVSFSDGKNVTGDNEKYIKFLWEVSSERIGINKKWMLQTKGGEARKWYGNILNIIAWSEEDIAFYHKNKISRVIKKYLWYKEGVTWSKICSNRPTFRYLRSDSTYDEVNITPKQGYSLYGILAILNTKMVTSLLNIINPTFSVQTENVLKMPFFHRTDLDYLAKYSIEISKSDWDSHETSWDFEQSPLLSIQQEMKQQGASGGNLLKTLVDKFIEIWEGNFMQLHQNEEELNRQFIEIYGLQDELTPDVPLNEITILQQGEITIE